MEYRGAIKTEPGITRYDLQIRNGALAQEYARNNRSIRVRNGTCTVLIQSGQPDPVMDMVTRGAVAYGLPASVMRIKRLEDTFPITRAEITSKHTRALGNIRQLLDFAETDDKQGFIDSCFLQREKEAL